MEFITPSAKPMTGKGALYYSLDGLPLLESVLASLDMTRKDFGAESIVDVSAGKTKGRC
jgi:hypothetical protein